MSCFSPETDSISSDSAAVIAGTEQRYISGRRKSVFRRLYEYFNESNIDRTSEKRFDVSFALGPNYSTNTEFGLGVLAAGLYRLDRRDTMLSPSDISLFANVSTTGYYQIGIEGNMFFPRGRHRLKYEFSFNSQPTDYWGIGYQAGNGTSYHNFTLKRYLCSVEYKYNLGRGCFIGRVITFYNYTAAPSVVAYLPTGQRRGYTYTSLGILFEYDTRDFIPNPYKGVYIRAQGQLFPRWLASARTFYRAGFSADYYRRVWRGAVLACDLFSEFNLGSAVPWVLLAEMGGSRRMRGYYKGRYRDRNMITAQVELRQKIYRRHGVAVWTGAGNVFPDFRRFKARHTLPEIGIGYRFEFKNRVNIRLDLGVGRNGTGINFNVNEAF